MFLSYFLMCFVVIKKQTWEGNKISHKKYSIKCISQDLKVQIFGKEKKSIHTFKIFLNLVETSPQKNPE